MRIKLENLTESQSFPSDWISWPAVERAGIRMANRGGTVTVMELDAGVERSIGHITTGGFEPVEPSYVQ